jgi:putative flippase GtrA
MKPLTVASSPFLRFLLVGGTFSLIYSVTTAALIRAGTPPLATSVVVYACCIPLAYLSHKHLAFGVAAARKTAFPLYVLTQVASLTAVSLVTTRFITHRFALDTAILLLTSALAAVGSFLINRFLIFRAQG